MRIEGYAGYKNYNSAIDMLKTIDKFIQQSKEGETININIYDIKKKMDYKSGLQMIKDKLMKEMLWLSYSDLKLLPIAGRTLRRYLRYARYKQHIESRMNKRVGWEYHI